MTTSIPSPAAEPVDLLLLAALALAEALAVLLVAALALVLTLAGWGPPAPPAAPLRPVLPPEADAAAPAPLEAVTVAELRQRARAAGHRSLARSGRRAELLQALAPTVPISPEAVPCA